MQIQPPEKAKPKDLICPFCQALWEFILSDSFQSATLTFQCLGCNKKITIEKL